MDKNLTRKCKECGGECVVFLKKHYLGIHFVEQCKCGIRLSTDPHSIKWVQYSNKSEQK